MKSITTRMMFLLAMVGLFAAPAQAEDSSSYFKDGLGGSFTFGAAGVGTDQRSFKFGEYTGISNNDGYFVGNSDLLYNRDNYYMNLQTQDLGLSNRSVFMETGEYGKYKLYTQFNQLPHLINNLAASPFQNSGNTSLLLGQGFGRAATTAAMGNIQRGEEIQTGRQTGVYGISGNLGGYDFDLSYRRDEKDGILGTGAAFGASASPVVVRSVILPDPVSQVSNEMHASLAHNGEKGQIQLNFDLSLFDNNNNSVSFQNPFAGLAGHPGTGLISRDPDNRFYRVGLSGGYNLPYSTRISAIAEYGSMRQDDTLLPYSFGMNPALLPRQSAQAEINTLHGMINLTSRPWEKFSFQAKYRHYQTINETPRQTFLPVVNDSGTQVAAANALNILPFDYIQNQAEVNGTYMAAKATNVKLGYKFDSMERDFREVKETREHTFKGGINSNYLENVSAGYNVSLSSRDQKDPYSEDRVHGARFTTASTATFSNHPNLRRYDVADKDTIRHSTNINYFPTEKLDIGIAFNYLDDNYRSSEMGLTFSRRYDATLDVNYALTQNSTLYAYYTFENIESEQNSRSITAAATTFSDISRNWTANHNNDTHTVGGGANASFMNNKLNFLVDYSLSDSREAITFRTGSNAAVFAPGNMPELKTLWHNLSATGKYRIAQDMDVGMRYIFQAFQTADFATDFFNPNSGAIPQVLTLYGTVPNYNAHVGMMFITYRFGAGSPATSASK